MRTPAQIVIYLDPETKEIKAEMPAPNGSRRKFQIRQKDLPAWMLNELTQLDFWLREQEKRKQELESQAAKDLLEAEKRFQKSLHQKNWDRTARNHNYGGLDGKGFANKTIGYRDEPRDKSSVEDLFS